MSRKTTTPDLAMSRRVGVATARATWITTGTPPAPTVRLTVTATIPGAKPKAQSLGDATTALETLLIAIRAAGLST